MASAYEITNPAGTYFLTLTIVDWVDVFTRKENRDIIIDSFIFCRENKGLKVYGFVIMTNHVHCILSARQKNLDDVLRDLKRHTSSKLLKNIQEPTESRRDWMLKRFEFAARSNIRNSKYQLWERNNHAIEIFSPKFLNQKLTYIHLNPVRAGFVDNVQDWIYSSARNYLLLPGVMDIDWPEDEIGDINHTAPLDDDVLAEK